MRKNTEKTGTAMRKPNKPKYFLKILSWIKVNFPKNDNLCFIIRIDKLVRLLTSIIFFLYKNNFFQFPESESVFFWMISRFCSMESFIACRPVA